MDNEQEPERQPDPEADYDGAISWEPGVVIPGDAVSRVSQFSVIAQTSGKTSSGETVDGNLSQDGTNGIPSTEVGIGIEEAGHKYTVWVSQQQGDAPKIGIADYTLPDEPHYLNMESTHAAYDTALGAKMILDMENAAQHAKPKGDGSKIKYVETSDFDTLAEDAHQALREAGIEKPAPAPGKTK